MEHTFSIAELAAEVNQDASEEVTPRTIRYWQAEKLLPPSDSHGLFTRTHLLRLQMILRLKQAHLPLKTIREQLEGLSDIQVEEKLIQNQNSAPVLDSALDYVNRLRSKSVVSLPEPTPPPAKRANAESWERIPIAKGVELHIQDNLAPEVEEFVEEILDRAAVRKLRR